MIFYPTQTPYHFVLLSGSKIVLFVFGDEQIIQLGWSVG